jgi:peroxiredoxin
MTHVSSGDQAPLDFNLVSSGNKVVNLRSLVGEKSLVVLFVPFAFTGVCTEELCTRNGALNRAAQLDANVVGISGDSNFVLNAWAKQAGIEITLLSDYDHVVARAFGVHSPNGFATAKNLPFIGATKRSAFVIDRKGVVRHAEVLADAHDLPNFAAIEAALAAIVLKPLAVGDVAPPFELVTLGEKGPEIVKLSELVAHKPAVLLFVPFAFTSVCSSELCSKNGALDKFASLDANVVGISGDSPFGIQEWRKESKISIRVLSDYDHVATQRYRVAFNAPLDETLIMRSAPERAAFVVDQSGVIQHVQIVDSNIEPDYAPIEAALAAIKANKK